MKISVKLDLNVPATVNRLNPCFQKAQTFLDSEVLRTSAPYVPMRSGALMRSGTTGTKIGTGKIVYNTPYAKRKYYGFGFHFSKDKHPQACAQWFEKAKATHKDAWLQGVSKIIKG